MYDRSFPAYYYPAVFFLNSTDTIDISAAKAAVSSFCVYLEITADSLLSSFEKTIKSSLELPTTDEQKTELFVKILEELRIWDYRHPGEDKVPDWLIDKIMMMGLIAGFSEQ